MSAGDVTAEPATGPTPVVRPRARRPSRLPYLLALAVVPLAMVAVAAWLGVVGLNERDGSLPLSGGVATTGTVLAATTACGHVCDHRALIGYTVAGQKYEAFGAPQDDTPQVGASVHLSYSPADPATMHDLDAHRTITLVILATAAVLGAIGVLALVGIAVGAVRAGR